eukprot:PhM_4_TR7754/c0_g1_i1/m.98276
MGCFESKGGKAKPSPVIANHQPHHRGGEDEVPVRAPLLDHAEREKIIATFERQFGVNTDFVASTVFAKLRLKKCLSDTRERIAARQNSNEEIKSGGGDGDEVGDLRRVSTMSIRRIQNDTAQERQSREEKIASGIRLLDERMVNFGLNQQVMRDDGNCQFRSIAHQVTGTQEKHLAVRREVVRYMTSVRKTEFDFFFESEAAATEYFQAMDISGTWGDELTLRAAADAFNLRIHVLTSEESNYYVVYQPNATDFAKAAVANDRAAEPLDIFLAYISPIHYNSIKKHAASASSSSAQQNSTDVYIK